MAIARKNVAAKCAALVVALALTGCGNWVGDYPAPNGTIGISVDKAGDPVIVLAVCSGKVTKIEMVGQLENEHDPNPKIGLWVAKTPVTGDATLNPLNPGDEWTATRQPTLFKPHRVHIVADQTPGTDQDPLLDDGTFTVAQLSKLTPDTVLYVDGIDTNSTIAKSEFRQMVCGVPAPTTGQ